MEILTRQAYMESTSTVFQTSQDPQYRRFRFFLRSINTCSAIVSCLLPAPRCPYKNTILQGHHLRYNVCYRRPGSSIHICTSISLQVRVILLKMPSFPVLNVTAQSKPHTISTRQRFTLIIRTTAETVK